VRAINWVDAVLAIIVAVNCVLGIRRGIFREFFNLAGIVLGLFVGFRLYEALGWNIEGWLDAKPAVANLAAFVVIFCAIAFGASWLGHLLHKGAKRLFVGWLDRLAGGVFGLARGLVFASVTALVFALFPFFPRLEKDLGTSLLGPHVVKIAPALYGAGMKKVRGPEHEGLDIKQLIDEYLASEEEEADEDSGPPPEIEGDEDKGAEEEEALGD
jgi:membrane protein required for colicin V production